MQWFENNDQYKVERPVPQQLGYDKLSLVRVYPNGKTQPGWGAVDFVDNYAKNKFDPQRALKFYQKYEQPFGLVMRSIPFLCVDIDGKNGGVATANTLNLPRTLAERSRSGNGYHLFYRIPYSVWNPLRGYDELPDLIGLVPGVDIKGTGVVFHYPNQRWNSLDVAHIPASLEKLVTGARDVKRITRMARTGVASMDADDLVIVHDQLKTELEGRFTAGGRNQKLFAIGAQMLAVGYPAWDIALYDRGVQIGLDMDEITSIINNIESYS